MGPPTLEDGYKYSKEIEYLYPVSRETGEGTLKTEQRRKEESKATEEKK